MSEQEDGLPNIVIIGSKAAREYLWNFFIKAYNHHEIILEFHDNKTGTANSIIDGLQQNFGWRPIDRRRVQKTITSADTKPYVIVANQVVLEQVGAIRDGV